MIVSASAASVARRRRIHAASAAPPPRSSGRGYRHTYVLLAFGLEAIGPSDDVEHDLVGARADAVQAHVAPHALDAVLLHVARAAVDLDALVGDLDGHARGVELGHRDLPHGVLAVLEAPRGHVDHLAGRLDLRGHLGELVADDLEVADLLAERLALERVAHRHLEAPLRAGDAPGRADQPLALELPHDVVE